MAAAVYMARSSANPPCETASKSEVRMMRSHLWGDDEYNTTGHGDGWKYVEIEAHGPLWGAG
jgi:hypothetical protein